jgi:hypothetical protein
MSSPKHYSTYRVAQVAALAKSLQVATEGAMLAKVAGRIDSTASTATYYIQVLNAASLPADGAVTLLIAPIKIQHTTGTDSPFDIDLTPDYIKSKNGIFIVCSTTEFTKTIVGSNILSCSALYR